MISLDTETTGMDRAHGCKPFFVTTCNDDGEQQFWEWDIDPLTRQPSIPKDDLYQIEKLLCVVGAWEGYDEEVQERHKLVTQNGKFDCLMLSMLGITCWPWSMSHDTLMAGHMLGSNQPHDLTSMALQYLGRRGDIKHLEDALGIAVKEARRVVQQAKLRVKRFRTGKAAKGKVQSKEPLAEWRIAKEGMDDLPSAKGQEGVWRNDYWLPRAMAKWQWECSIACEVFSQVQHDGYEETMSEVEGWEWRPPSDSYEGCHSWWTVLSDYSNADSAVTLALWKVMGSELKRRKLWRIYQERMKVLPILVKMEGGTGGPGVTLNVEELDHLRAEFTKESQKCAAVCYGIAEGYGYNLELPKSSNNKSLTEFCFSPHLLNLPVVARTEKSGNPSIDSKKAIPEWLAKLPERSKQLEFVKALASKRKRDTGLGFMDSYSRYMIPLKVWVDGYDPQNLMKQRVISSKALAEVEGHYDKWHSLFPSVNPTSTATLRMSSSNPNGQQISKQETDCPKCKGEGEGPRGICLDCGGSGKDLLSLRRMFGPAPGREWWSLDYQNIELRIPAYVSGERKMIELFEHPDDPPYFGSQHLLNAHVVFKDAFELCRDERGQLDGRIFKKRHAANLYQNTKNGDFAIQYNCGEVTADRTFRRPGAYRLLKSSFVLLEGLNQRMIQMADKLGYVETLPDRNVDPDRGYPLLCTRTEWGKVLPTVPLSYFVQGTAMWCTIKAMSRVDDYLESLNKQELGSNHRIVLQVHDELVVEMPFNPNKGNLPKVMEIKRLMQLSGDDIGVPLGVGVEYNVKSWGQGETIKL